VTARISPNWLADRWLGSERLTPEIECGRYSLT
jgi:hypothetical protein